MDHFITQTTATIAINFPSSLQIPTASKIRIGLEDPLQQKFWSWIGLEFMGRGKKWSWETGSSPSGQLLLLIFCSP